MVKIQNKWCVITLWNYTVFILLHINSITKVTSEEKVFVKHCEAVTGCLIVVIIVSTFLVRQHFIRFSYLYELFISLRRTILIWMPIGEIVSSDNTITVYVSYTCIRLGSLSESKHKVTLGKVILL